jgi:hypothetical protein
VAIHTTFAFIHRPISKQSQVESHLLALRRTDGHRQLARHANHPHQPLRHNTVERRHEIVGLDTHVDKATDHVERIVSVDGTEDQVPGQRRLNGDLGRLRVTDLSDHDLVRIVS